MRGAYLRTFGRSYSKIMHENKPKAGQISPHSVQQEQQKKHTETHFAAALKCIKINATVHHSPSNLPHIEFKIHPNHNTRKHILHQMITTWAFKATFFSQSPAY